MTEQANIWLNDCLNGLKTNFSKTFKYATNLKSLVIIRDAVIEFESSIQVESVTVVKNQQFSWSIVCEKLFNRKVEIWSHLVVPFYYSQAKVFSNSCIFCYCVGKNFLYLKLIFETSLQNTHETLVKELKEFISDKTFKEQK